MSKFDVNTKMTLDDFLKAVVKNSTLTTSNDNTNNNSSNNNKLTGKTVNPNATSKNLLNSLNDNSTNTGITNNTYQGEIPVGVPVGVGVPVNDPNANMMGMNNGYGQGYGQGNMGLDGLNSLFGNRTSEEKDTRKREDIENENVDKVQENSTLSRENEKHKAEIEELRKKGDPESMTKVDELNAKIAKNENKIEGNKRTIKENEHAIYKQKTNLEVAKEKLNKAKDLAKSGVNTIANAPGYVYEKGKKILTGNKDIDDLDKEHTNLNTKLSNTTDELTRLNNILKNPINDEGKPLNKAEIEKLADKYQKFKSEKTELEGKINENRETYKKKGEDIQNIIKNTIDTPEHVHVNRIEDDAKQSTSNDNNNNDKQLRGNVTAFDKIDAKKASQEHAEEKIKNNNHNHNHNDNSIHTSNNHHNDHHNDHHLHTSNHRGGRKKSKSKKSTKKLQKR